MKKLPAARTAEIAVQELGKETLIYDLIAHHAFGLNETSGIVYRACDGQTSFDELKNKYQLTDDLIYLALDKLAEKGLLNDYRAHEHFAGLSRREVLKRVGLGSMTALPVIVALVAPPAAHAASGRQALSTSCTQNSDCSTGFCAPTRSSAAPASPSAGTYCCYAATAPGGVILVQPGGHANGGTAISCAGALQRSYCCSNNTVYTPGSTPSSGSCDCTT